MPSNVRKFAILSLVVQLIAIAVSLVDFPDMADTYANAGGGTFLLALYIPVYTLALLLIWLTAGRRKNWARIAFLIWWLLNFVGYAVGIAIDPATYLGNPLDFFSALAQIVLQTMALYYVFSGNAKPWFLKEAAA